MLKINSSYRYILYSNVLQLCILGNIVKLYTLEFAIVNKNVFFLIL